MNIKQLNEELNKVIINESFDYHEIITRKQRETRNLLKSKFNEIVDWVSPSNLTGMSTHPAYRIFQNNLMEVSNCFQQIDKLINDYNDEAMSNREQVEEINDWYKQKLNKLIIKLDSFLKNIANINLREITATL